MSAEWTVCLCGKTSFAGKWFNQGLEWKETIEGGRVQSGSGETIREKESYTVVIPFPETKKEE